MNHSTYSYMRALGFLSVLVAATLVAMGQNTAPETRKLSLEDCIRTALEHNLEVQVRKYDPQLANYALGGTYGAYDPEFQLSMEHSFNQSPGGVDDQGRPYAGRELEGDSYRTGIGGVLPWGLNYSLGMGMSDQTISTPGRPATGQPQIIENTFFDTSTSNNVTLLTTNYPIAIPAITDNTVSGQLGLFSMRQPLLRNFWTDNTRLQITLNKQNIRLSELDLQQQVIDTVTAVELAYFNLIFAQESVTVQQKALELAERLLAENRKRVEVGALAPLDEKQAEAQAAASRADLLDAEGNEDTQQRVLKALLSDDYSQWFKVKIQPGDPMVALPEKFDIQDSWRRGMTLRPDLQQQKIALEKQGYIVKFQKNQLYPQLDVVGSYGYSASAPQWGDAMDQFSGRDNPFWTVGGQMSIPLGNRSARYNYKTAKATQERINLQLKQLQQRIMILIEDSIATAQVAFQRVKATREARSFAAAALDAEQKKLESGKSTSFEVLRLQRDLTTAASSEIRALADYNVALARLAQTEGSTLERRRVNMSFQ
jgi:outer membrane protein TolC